MSRIRLIIASLTLSLLVVSPRVAQGAPDLERLELELSDYEWKPNRAALKLHGPEVSTMLRQIVRQTRRPIARTRALTVLRWYPSADTQRVLLQQIQRHRTAKRGVALIDLQQAVVSYAVVVGTKALGLVARLLSHPNIDVRCSAAAAVRLTGSPKAAALISAQLTKETSSTARAELQRQLKLLAKKK